MFKKLGLIIFVFIFSIQLLACSTPKEQAEQRRQERIEREIVKIKKEEARQRYIAKLSKKCRGYGFKAETTEFAQCLQKAEQQDLLSSSVHLQHQQVQQNERSPFQGMIDADKHTRELFKD